jgi:hypothetical protein
VKGCDAGDFNYDKRTDEGRSQKGVLSSEHQNRAFEF